MYCPFWILWDNGRVFWDIDGHWRTLMDKHHENFSHKIWTQYDRGSMKHEESSFQKNLENFRFESFSIRTTTSEDRALELQLIG